MKKKYPIIPFETLTEVAETLRVLGHPHRLKMIELLDAEDLSVGELADRIGLAPHATSQHLRILCARRVVEATREGKTVYYRVTSIQARNVLQCIRSHQK